MPQYFLVKTRPFEKEGQKTVRNIIGRFHKMHVGSLIGLIHSKPQFMTRIHPKSMILSRYPVS